MTHPMPSELAPRRPPARPYEMPVLESPCLYTVDQLGRALRLMRRLRHVIGGLDEVVLPPVVWAELQAVDVATRRLLFIAKHGVHYPSLGREDCDRASAVLDADPDLDNPAIRHG